jgi:hypothetical protein
MPRHKQNDTVAYNCGSFHQANRYIRWLLINNFISIRIILETELQEKKRKEKKKKERSKEHKIIQRHPYPRLHFYITKLRAKKALQITQVNSDLLFLNHCRVKIKVIHNCNSDEEKLN